MFHVVWQPMLRIAPAIFELLFVKHVHIVKQWRPRGFVIINQVIIAANGLNKPDCRGIAYPKVLRGMHRSAGFDLQRTDPLLRFHVLQRIGVDRAKDGRRELAEIFLSEVGIPLNLAI